MIFSFLAKGARTHETLAMGKKPTPTGKEDPTTRGKKLAPVGRRKQELILPYLGEKSGTQPTQQ